MNIHQEDLVSIIVRTVQSNYLFLLRQALESIINNDYRPLEIIIVIQLEDEDFVDKVQYLSDVLGCQDVMMKLIINRTSQDERAKNLNLGLQFATGKYIGFLDDDDVIYPNHIKILVDALNQSPNHAWAYTDCASVVCECDQDGSYINIISKSITTHQKNHFSLSKLCQNGFIAIHSYLIDRTKIGPELLNFNESLSVLEDYEFMLKLAKYKLPIYVPSVTAEYRHYTDSRNSSYFIDQESGKNYQKKAEIWWKSYKYVEEIKKEIFPSYHSPWFSYARRSYLSSKLPLLHHIRSLWHKLKRPFSS